MLTLLLSRPGATCALKNLLEKTTLLAGSMIHIASGQRGVGVSTAVRLYLSVMGMLPSLGTTNSMAEPAADSTSAHRGAAAGQR
jgi:hypothetical protein